MGHRKLVFPSNTFPYMSLDQELREKSETNTNGTSVGRHRTGIAEVTGSNSVEALLFFRLLPSNCFNWKIYCDDTLHFHLQPQYNMNFIYISQIYFRCRFIYVFASLNTYSVCLKPKLIQNLSNTCFTNGVFSREIL